MSSKLFRDPLTFLDLPRSSDFVDADVAILGLPFDCARDLTRFGPRQGPNAVRRADYLELMHSAGLWLDDLTKPRPTHIFNIMDLESVTGNIRPVDGMAISHLHDRKLRFSYDPEQPLSTEVRDLIHRQSVEDAQTMMNWVLQKSVMPMREEKLGDGYPPAPEVDLELEERRLRHEGLCDEADGRQGRQRLSRMHVQTMAAMFTVKASI